MSSIPSPDFTPVITVPLYLEYQDTLTRPENLMGKRDSSDIDIFLRYLCSIAVHQDVHFSWRPWLPDSDDDMVLEAAVASDSDYIVSYNKRDFEEVSSFGISVLTPSEFLAILYPFRDL